MAEQIHDSYSAEDLAFKKELPFLFKGESRICSAVITTGSKLAGISSVLPPLVIGMSRKCFGKTFLERGYVRDKDCLIAMAALRNMKGNFSFRAVRLESHGRSVKMRLTPFLFAFFRDWSLKDSSFGRICKDNVAENDIRQLEIRLFIERL